MPAEALDDRYWSDELAGARARGEERSWYEYMEEVYRRLVAGAAEGPSLKTDLFEEARGGRGPLLALRPPVHGADLSPEVVEAARRRLGGAVDAENLVVGDVRALPFEDGYFHFILSGSTLDHFESPAEIDRALAELARVLAPGGTLVLTMDNPHNPVVALRNKAAWTRRLRLDSYFVGATLTVEGGRAALARAGLTVTSVEAVAHAPRDLAMRLARLVDRRAASERARWVRLLMSFERLQRSRLARRTGYYLAFTATRDPGPAEPGPSRPSGVVH